jgi:excisionase family DNA binding protein
MLGAKMNKSQNGVLEKLTSIENLLKGKNDKPLNLIQAAEYLGLRKSYLYKLTSKKLIPHSKPTGKVIFFSKVELDHWALNKTMGQIK